MKDKEKEKKENINPEPGHDQSSTGLAGGAMAAAGAMTGGAAAIATGATAGSAAGPIGAAVGAVVGGAIGTALEHKAVKDANPKKDSEELTKEATETTPGDPDVDQVYSTPVDPKERGR